MTTSTRLFFFSYAVLLAFAGVYAAGNVSEAERIAEELLLDGRLAVWQILENDVARKAIQSHLDGTKVLFQTPVSAIMMRDVTQQFKDTLTDAEKGSVSAKHIADGLYEMVTNEGASLIIKEIFDSLLRLIDDPDLETMLVKLFNFLEACVRSHRGADLIIKLADGVVENVLVYDDPKETIIKAFKNGKTIIGTSLSRKAFNFFKG